MFNRNHIIGAAIAGVVVLVLGLFFILGGKHSKPDTGFFGRIANGVSAVTGTQTPEEMAAAPEFAFHRLEIDTSRAQPQACLVFTRALDVSGRTHYEDYLTVDPAARIVVRPLDARLCIAGLSFNATYTRNTFDNRGYPSIGRDSYELTTEWTNSLTISNRDRVTFGLAWWRSPIVCQCGSVAEEWGRYSGTHWSCPESNRRPPACTGCETAVRCNWSA